MKGYRLLNPSLHHPSFGYYYSVGLAQTPFSVGQTERSITSRTRDLTVISRVKSFFFFEGYSFTLNTGYPNLKVDWNGGGANRGFE